jgi:hypothetical protein
MHALVTRTLSAAAAAGALTILSLTAARAAGAASRPGPASAGPGLANPPSGGIPLYTSANCTLPIVPIGPPSEPLQNAASQSSATPPAPPPCTAGYQASGRDFRFAQALITVPEHAGNTAIDPAVYVALDASTPVSSDYARAGIEPDLASPSGWDTFFEVQEPTLANPILITNPVSDALEGDGIFFSVYLNAAGNSLHFVTTLPNGTTARSTVALNGPVYTAAQALADWSATTTPQPAVPAANTRVSQFYQGRFTTLGGAQGTFDGPWNLNPVELTSNGFAVPLGTLIAAPSYLWNDATTPQGTDAFGVWLYG